MTDRAVERIRALEAVEGRPTALRLRVDSGGCNGFEYVFDLEPAGGAAPAADAEEDLVDMERGGAHLRVDRLSLPFLRGAVVDFASTLMSSSFVVASNPNAANSCGCKHSFAVDPVRLSAALDEQNEPGASGASPASSSALQQ